MTELFRWAHLLQDETDKGSHEIDNVAEEHLHMRTCSALYTCYWLSDFRDVALMLLADVQMLLLIQELAQFIIGCTWRMPIVCYPLLFTSTISVRSVACCDEHLRLASSRVPCLKTSASVQPTMHSEFRGSFTVSHLRSFWLYISELGALTAATCEVHERLQTLFLLYCKCLLVYAKPTAVGSMEAAAATVTEPPAAAAVAAANICNLCTQCWLAMNRKFLDEAIVNIQIRISACDDWFASEVWWITFNCQTRYHRNLAADYWTVISVWCIPSGSRVCKQLNSSELNSKARVRNREQTVSWHIQANLQLFMNIFYCRI